MNLMMISKVQSSRYVFLHFNVASKYVSTKDKSQEAKNIEYRERSQVEKCVGEEAEQAGEVLSTSGVCM